MLWVHQVTGVPTGIYFFLDSQGEFFYSPSPRKQCIITEITTRDVNEVKVVYYLIRQNGAQHRFKVESNFKYVWLELPGNGK
jgi:hypothetical protein